MTFFVKKIILKNLKNLKKQARLIVLISQLWNHYKAYLQIRENLGNTCRIYTIPIN